jgi:hypothetical protein
MTSVFGPCPAAYPASYMSGFAADRFCFHLRPLEEKDLRLLQHYLSALFLCVRWIAILAQNALEDDTKLRPHVLSNHPVDAKFFHTAATSSRAIASRDLSPTTLTALSFTSRLLLSRDILLQHRTNRLEERHIIPNLQCLIMRNGQAEGL